MGSKQMGARAGAGTGAGVGGERTVAEHLLLVLADGMTGVGAGVRAGAG